jgi:PTH2 family peptidyl-tRNA hydrolase
MLISTAIIAGISGYMIGIASSLGFFPIPFLPKAPKERGIANYDDEEESEDEDIDESILDHAPNWANGLEADKRDGLRATKEVKKEEPVKTGLEDSTEECKLVLVVRTDLGMTKGKFLPLPSHSSISNVDFSRENCSTMRPRNPSMLQKPPPHKVAFITQMGENGSSEGCTTN